MLTRCLARAVVLLGVAAVGGIASPSALDAQSVPVVALKPPGARLSEEFSRIVGVRELPNRRVLVADVVEKRVVLVDFGSGSVTPAAVNGQGPTEFTNAAVIWPLGRDSSLMADMSSRRWHIFVGSRLVGMVPPDHPAHSATGSSVLGTDSLGFILARRPIQRDHGAAHFGTLDSSLVLLVELKSGSIDTIATVAPGEGTMHTSGPLVNGRPQRIVMQFPMLSVGEQGLLAPDGWVAVARRNPYRVDWRSPQGQWIHGSPLPFTKIEVDEREKEAYLERSDRPTRTPPPGTILTWVSDAAAF